MGPHARPIRVQPADHSAANIRLVWIDGRERHRRALDSRPTF
jgi:hypothetical protein